MNDPEVVRVFLSRMARGPPTKRWRKRALTDPVEQTRKTNIGLLRGLLRSVESVKT